MSCCGDSNNADVLCHVERCVPGNVGTLTYLSLECLWRPTETNDFRELNISRDMDVDQERRRSNHDKAESSSWLSRKGNAVVLADKVTSALSVYADVANRVRQTIEKSLSLELGGYLRAPLRDLENPGIGQHGLGTPKF